MRFVYILLVVLFTAIVVLFTFQNLDTVTVSPYSSSITLPVSILVILIYVLGMFTGGSLLAFLRTSYRHATHITTSERFLAQLAAPVALAGTELATAREQPKARGFFPEPTTQGTRRAYVSNFWDIVWPDRRREGAARRGHHQPRRVRETQGESAFLMCGRSAC